MRLHGRKFRDILGCGEVACFASFLLVIEFKIGAVFVKARIKASRRPSNGQVLSQFTRSYDIVAAALFCQSRGLETAREVGIVAKCKASGHDRVVAMASGAKIEFANKQGRPDNDNQVSRCFQGSVWGFAHFRRSCAENDSVLRGGSVRNCVCDCDT